MDATARACINLALIKYWGKLPGPDRLPATGSLSLTVDSYYTETRVSFGAESDALSIDGRATEGEALIRAKRVLDAVRRLAGRTDGARVESRNFVPAGEGLASSASAFAALAAAAAQAAGLSPSPQELAALARVGSGSAARSAFGGLCYIPGPGERAAYAVDAPADFVSSLRMVIGRVGERSESRLLGGRHDADPVHEPLLLGPGSSRTRPTLPRPSGPPNKETLPP